jgi:hypothetical protein
MKGKTRKLIVYQSKDNGQMFLNATDSNFKLKQPAKDYGKALSSNVSNEELGRWVREVLKNCD